MREIYVGALHDAVGIETRASSIQDGLLTLQSIDGATTIWRSSM